jgi:hypothetical protein
MPLRHRWTRRRLKQPPDPVFGKHDYREPARRSEPRPRSVSASTERVDTKKAAPRDGLSFGSQSLGIIVAHGLSPWLCQGRAGRSRARASPRQEKGLAKRARLAHWKTMRVRARSAITMRWQQRPGTYP